jgi:hypothetical protein
MPGIGDLDDDVHVLTNVGSLRVRRDLAAGRIEAGPGQQILG